MITKPFADRYLVPDITLLYRQRESFVSIPYMYVDSYVIMVILS